MKPLEAGRYMKVVDGEALGEATPGEVRCYFLQKKFPSVEVGFLEVALALAGVTGIISTISTFPVVQFFSVAAFFFSVVGAYNLTWLYVQPRLPIAWTHYLTSPVKQRYPWFPFPFWLFFYFIKQAIRLSISSTGVDDQLLEASYLMLVIAVITAGVALTTFVFLKISATLASG